MLPFIKQKIRNILNPDVNQYLEKQLIKKQDCSLLKFGTTYGPYTISVNFINSNSICYSFGAREDISFDCSLVKKFHCRVYIMDPTPRAFFHFQTL